VFRTKTSLTCDYRTGQQLMPMNSAASKSDRAKTETPQPMSSKRIWIDLDNSPHIPFFAPIIDALRQHGYSITLTARDAYQVCELADRFQFNYKRVGRHWGKHVALKIVGTCLRVAGLLPIIIREKPDLAVSHGSRSQILVAKLLRIPSLCMFDYEFAGSLSILKPTWSMTPTVISASGLTHKSVRLLQYPGIKEDVYVPTFQPDPSIMGRLGLNGDDVIVVVRPPADEAHYRSPMSDELFAATLALLGTTPNVQVILSPRNRRQADALRETWAAYIGNSKFLVLEQAEDGLNLIWHADLVISGGGTMNREAAALGIPVYSIFRGKIGAVDQYLAERGRLVLLQKDEDVKTKLLLIKRTRAAAANLGNRETLTVVVRHIISVVEGSATSVSKGALSAVPSRL
jgi:predicted glycosyltransferase